MGNLIRKMSGQKRKINNISNNLPIYPGKLKNAKYSHTPVLFPQIVKVEPMNINLNHQDEHSNKLHSWVSKLENKINKLETLVKYQNKKIDKLENEINNFHSYQQENNEIRELVNEVQQKLNLPEDAKSGLNQEAKLESDFSYIS